MLYFLKISSIVFIMSLFTGNGACITFSLTLFLIAVILNCRRIWKTDDIVNIIIDTSFNKGSQYLKNKKYVKGITYLIAPSMLVIGIIFAGISLACMWIMVFQ